MYKNKCCSQKSRSYSSNLKALPPLIGVLLGLFICFIIFKVVNNVDKTDTQIQLLEFQIKDLEIKYDSLTRQKQLTEIKDYMEQINLQNVDIVYAQLLLETGYLTSPLFHSNNNLFGMKPSYQRPTTNISIKGYAKYDTWKESVLDYALWQVKYAHNLSKTEYLQFLAKYYAKDKEYINKLKKIIK